MTRRGDLVTVSLQGDFGKPRPALDCGEQGFLHHVLGLRGIAQLQAGIAQQVAAFPLDRLGGRPGGGFQNKSF